MAKETKFKPEDVPNPKVKLVYIGPCTTADKKLGGVFLPITNDQLREKRLLPYRLLRQSCPRDRFLPPSISICRSFSFRK